jgi:hypothetical protein
MNQGQFLQIPEFMLDSPPVSRAVEQVALPHRLTPVRDALPARRLSSSQIMGGSAYALELPGAHPFQLGCNCSWCFITSKLHPADPHTRKVQS